VRTHDDDGGIGVVGMDESEWVVLNGWPELIVSSISSALRTTWTGWLARLGAGRRVTELARIESALAALQIIMTTDTKERAQAFVRRRFRWPGRCDAYLALFLARSNQPMGNGIGPSNQGICTSTISDCVRCVSVRSRSVLDVGWWLYVGRDGDSGLVWGVCARASGAGEVFFLPVALTYAAAWLVSLWYNLVCLPGSFLGRVEILFDSCLRPQHPFGHIQQLFLP
jgi:hypothetical protein